MYIYIYMYFYLYIYIRTYGKIMRCFMVFNGVHGFESQDLRERAWSLRPLVRSGDGIAMCL